MNSKYNCIIFIKKWINLTSRILDYTNLCKHLINPLKPRGNYMYHLLYHSVTLHFIFVGFVMILRVNRDYFLKPR
jgi:hypothetical protein